MSNPLFSTYRKNENRVTSTILAVLERISFDITERIFNILLEESEQNLLTFENQVTIRNSKSTKSIPDAKISASFGYWIETKIVRNEIEENQVRKYLEVFDDRKYEEKRLIILTPDKHIPNSIRKIVENDDRIVWKNFDELVSAIEESIKNDENLLLEENSLATESEKELLRELVQFIIAEDLIPKKDQVLIVPARRAYKEYKNTSLYICQPNRSFRPTDYIGFYIDKKLKKVFPKIKSHIESIKIEEDFDEEKLSDEQIKSLKEAIKKIISNKSTRLGKIQKVLFLSKIGSKDTIKITNDIKHNLKSESGRNSAFVRKHRYVSLKAVRNEPKTTKELLKFESVNPES